MRAADALPPKERVGLGDIELAYLGAGLPGRPAVLWLHGFPRNAYLWRGCLGPVAAAGYRCVAPDLLGLGESAGPQAADYSLRGQARLLDAFLDRLGAGGVRVVGEGIGATVGLALAALRPGRAKGLILADPPPEPPETSLLQVASALARWGYGESVLWALRAARAAAAIGLAAEPDGDPTALARDLYLRPILADAESRGRILALLGSLRGAEGREIREEFARRAAAPVLVCRERPSARPIRNGRAAGAPGDALGAIPRSHSVPLPDRAARIVERDPERFLQIVLPFLEAVG